MALNIEVVSDLVCPWCFIGKRRLDAALRAHGKSAPSVTWMPYQLNPNLPPEGVDRKAYYEQKFGIDRAREMSEHLTELGKEDGIDFHFERIAKSPNTLQGHRLVWLARSEGVQDAIVEALFLAYFTEGRDIGDTKVLADIGAAHGIAKERLQKFFSGAEGIHDVQLEIQAAIERGVTLVPFFILNKEHWISGADTVETFTKAFSQLD